MKVLITCEENIQPQGMTLRAHITSLVAFITLILALLVGQVPAQSAEIPLANPAPMVWSPDGRYVYFGTGVWPTTPGTGTISRLDLTTNTTSTVITIPDPAGCHAYATALAITPDAKKLYVGGYSCVMTVDLEASPATYTSSFTGNNWVQEIVVGSDAAYAIHPEGSAIFKTTKSGSVWGDAWTQLGGGGWTSRGGALSADGSTLYVGQEGRDLRQINTSTGTESFFVGSGSASDIVVSPDGSFALVSNARTITKLKLTGTGAGTVVQTVSLGTEDGVGRMAFDRTGQYVYVNASGSKSITKLNASDLSIAGRIALASSEPAANWIAANPTATGPELIATFGQRGITAGDYIRTYPMGPGAPRLTNANAARSSAIVSFDAGSDNLAPITNYEYRINGTGSWTALSPADTTSPVTVPGLPNGTSVGVELRAVNSQGGGTASNSMTVTPQGPPSAPRSVSTTAGDGVATISFTDPADDGGHAITNYQYSLDAGSTWRTLSPASTASPISVTGLTNGVTYQIQIRAINSQGDGDASTSLATTPNFPSIGGTGSSEPTPAPTEPTVVDSTEAPAPQAVPEPVNVGESLIVVNGVTARVAVEVLQGNKWRIRGDDFTLEFVPQANLGEIQGAFSAKAGSYVDVNGDGFSPGTLIASYLPGALADSLGQSRINEDGTFSLRAKFPSSLSAGQYVFQINGLSSPTSTRSVNLGVQMLVADPVTRKAVSKRIMFAPDSAALTTKAKATIAKFAKQHRGSAKSAVIVASAASGATAEQKALAKARARALVKAVKSHNSKISVRVAPRVRITNESSAGNRATVWFRFTAPKK